MQAKPKSAINQLSQERCDLWSEIAATHVVDEINIRRLIKKLDAMIVPSEAHSVEAAIALHEQAYLYAYQMKIDVALKLFDDSVRAGLIPIAAMVSKTHALYICGRVFDAMNQIMSVDLKSVEPTEILGLANTCTPLGLFKMAAELYKSINEVQGQTSRQIVEAANIMDQIGATDEQVNARLATASKIIMSMTGQPHIALDVFAMRGEGILYRFMVRDTVERLIEIDQAIDSALSEIYNDAIDQVLSIGVAPHDRSAKIQEEASFNVCMQ